MSEVDVSPPRRSIHEMLKDTPPLNDSDNAVHSGTPPPHVPNNTRPRPATINLNVNNSYTSQSCKIFNTSNFYFLKNN